MGSSSSSAAKKGQSPLPEKVPLESQKTSISKQPLKVSVTSLKRPTNLPELLLTNRQFSLLQKTFPTDFNDLYEVVAKIFAYMFELNPNAKGVFQSFFTTAHTEGGESAGFHKFYLQFVKIMSTTVSNLQFLQDKVEPILYNVGVRHIRLKDKGFHGELFDTFAVATSKAFVEFLQVANKFPLEEILELGETWEKLANHMVAVLKAGLNEV